MDADPRLVLFEGKALRMKLSPTRWTPASSFLALALISGAAPLARADIYRFTIQSQPSSVATDLTASTTLAGTLIGDHDPKTNPTGTRTIPGAFGGDTNANLPIDFSGTAGFTGSDTTHPDGQFTLNIDPETGTATVAGLSLNLINGSPIGVTLGLVIEYDTFRTRQPTSLYIGGIPLPIPFGQVTLSMLTFVQTELTGAGIVTETGPGQFSVTLIAPVEVMAQLDILGQMQVIGPITIPLPFTADITLSGTTASAVFSFDTAFQQDIPFTFDLPADQPLDLPTILPPGGTAHLLVNGAIDGAAINFAIDASLIASGVLQQRNPADWNNDGIVNTLDYFAFLVSFFAVDADFNEDSFTNSQDYFDFVTAYFGAI